MAVRKEIEDFRTMMVRALNWIYLGRLYDKNWGAEFSWKEATTVLEKVEAATLDIDIKSLTKEEMIAVGFPCFEGDRYCIPAYFHKAAIAQGLMSETDDTDTRGGGMWAFVTPSDCEQPKLGDSVDGQHL